MSDTRKDGLENLGGDAEAAADRPMSADPGARGDRTSGQGGGATAGVAAQGGLSDTASQQAGTGASTPDQRPSLDVQRDAAALRQDADNLERQADVRPDSELGRLGPGGTGVGNTVAPQGYVGGEDRGGS